MLIGSCFLQCIEYFYYTVTGILLCNKALKQILKIKFILHATATVHTVPTIHKRFFPTFKEKIQNFQYNFNMWLPN